MRGSKVLFFLAHAILLGNIIFSLYGTPTHTFAQSPGTRTPVGELGCQSPAILATHSGGRECVTCEVNTRFCGTSNACYPTNQACPATSAGLSPGGAQAPPATIVNSSSISLPNSQFQPLAGIPGLTDIGGRDEDRLVNLLNAGYRLAITIGALAAVFQISFAGFKYLSSAGNHGGMGEAKATITASLAGLLLILSTVLILETISGEIKLDPLRGAPPASIATPSPAATTGGSGALTGGTGNPESGRVCQPGASQGSSTNCTPNTTPRIETSTEREPEPIYIEVGCDGATNVQWGNSGCVPLSVEPSAEEQCPDGYEAIRSSGVFMGCLLYSYGTIETECRESYSPRGGTCYLND